MWDDFVLFVEDKSAPIEPEGHELHISESHTVDFVYQARIPTRTMTVAVNEDIKLIIRTDRYGGVAAVSGILKYSMKTSVLRQQIPLCFVSITSGADFHHITGIPIPFRQFHGDRVGGI